MAQSRQSQKELDKDLKAQAISKLVGSVESSSKKGVQAQNSKTPS